ncbi:PH domain-containing protein [Aerolutibacter ruishenii]|uniref:PH (Pleckstrin Homology) domain-containing protein n=1 Tax=Aerolutibacter ruishenii TaxID=686800 RepID=A0A562LI84_9GAMM|nr:PH domain-containing protein [Lysobacter ruishenii]TWI07332.1 PH (Pleckstrin Homology) domain-containing protein [Lysobacter ruishenii]
MTRAFPVVPPPSHAAWLLGGLLAIPLIAIAVSMHLGPSAADRGAAMPAFAFAVVIVGAVAAFTFWGLGRRQVLLDERGLQVKAAMFSHRVGAADLDVARARIVDLDERTELKPVLKTFGMSLPGFHAGWFMLRDRSGGFCLLTSRRRVLWLPTRSGKSLLLSLERPEALLDALHRINAPIGPRA